MLKFSQENRQKSLLKLKLQCNEIKNQISKIYCVPGDLVLSEKAKRKKDRSSNICIFNRVAGRVVPELRPVKKLEREERHGCGHITGGLVDCQKDFGFTLNLTGRIRQRMDML